MAKLDKKAIEELIKEVLNEENTIYHQATDDDKTDAGNPQAKKLAGKFGSYDNGNYIKPSSKGQAWLKMYAADGDKNDLTDEDLKALLKRKFNDEAYKLLRNLINYKDYQNVDPPLTDAQKKLRDDLAVGLKAAAEAETDEKIKKQISRQS